MFLFDCLNSTDLEAAYQVEAVKVVQQPIGQMMHETFVSIRPRQPIQSKQSSQQPAGVRQIQQQEASDEEEAGESVLNYLIFLFDDKYDVSYFAN